MNRLSAFALALAVSAPLQAAYKAVIIRDTFGVPHIFGKTEGDVGFGFGYAQAEDRLDAMLSNYLKACGREASVYGIGYLDYDVQTHLAQIPECVAENYKSLDPKVKEYVEGFAAGIGHYMKTHADKAPEWARPPTPQEILTFPKYCLMQESLSIALSEGRRLLPLPEKEGEEGQDEDGGAKRRKKKRASNAWAIGKGKSATGRAMLQMDQHTSYAGMGQWYEAHLCGGALNVAGATTFGNPFLLIGHNEKIAWTSTASSPDTADVYFEKMNPENRNQYQVEDGWHDVEVRKVKIGVKRGDKIEDKECLLEYTLHGPVFLHTHEKLYSAKYSDFGNIDFAAQYYRINTAGDVEDFKKAMRLLGIPRDNYLCADAEGNIYYLYNARVARKSEDVDWSGPVPGWTRETEWGEIIPFDELPQVMNPESGFLQNCNDGPLAVSPDADIDLQDAPSYLVRWKGASPGVRGERATKLLDETEKFTFEQFRAISSDNYSMLLARTIRSMVDAYAIQPEKGSPKVEQAMKLLKEWDHRLSADNVAMMFYTIWRMEMSGGSAPKGSRGTLLAMERAVERLTKLYGRIDVKWGPHHVIERGGKTFPVATGGADAQTLFMATGSFRDGNWVCMSGSTYRMAVELASPPVAFSVFPLGMSDDPASPHCTDLTALYAEGKYKPLWFSKKDISENKEKEYTVECE